MQYWDIQNTGAKEVTQRDVSKFKNHETEMDKRKDVGLRKYKNPNYHQCTGLNSIKRTGLFQTTILRKRKQLV